MQNLIIENKTECEIVTSRIINYNQEMVFEAWANPSILQFWWGPKGFTNLFLEHHFVEKGNWNFVMFSPEGKEFVNECVFVKIEKPKLIVWNHLPKPVFQVQVFFKKITETSTEISFKMVFQTKKERDKLHTFILEKNEENLDKLEIEMKKM